MKRDSFKRFCRDVEEYIVDAEHLMLRLALFFLAMYGLFRLLHNP